MYDRAYDLAWQAMFYWNSMKKARPRADDLGELVRTQEEELHEYGIIRGLQDDEYEAPDGHAAQSSGVTAAGTVGSRMLPSWEDAEPSSAWQPQKAGHRSPVPR